MGLDMYLSIRKNAYTSEFRKNMAAYPDEISAIAKVDSKSISVATDYSIGYWRKANAIHGWIIENCAGGVDECQDIEITVDQLAELREACVNIMLAPEKAEQLLPTTDGFFFGSTAYDEWYMRDVQYTADLLQGVISFMEKNNGQFEYSVIYRASW